MKARRYLIEVHSCEVMRYSVKAVTLADALALHRNLKSDEEDGLPCSRRSHSPKPDVFLDPDQPEQVKP